MTRRILFVMLHPGFIRYYEDAVRALADAGHHVHLAFETSRDKLNESELAARLAAASERITCGTTPPRVESVRAFLARGDRSATRGGDGSRPKGRSERREEAWESLATTVRLITDYLRFFEPAFAGAHRLRDRAEKRLPRVYVRPVRAIARAGVARRALAAALRGLERLIPIHPAIDEFVRDQRPDLLLVTPLIELGSQQVDYVKCARRLGVRSALCVASWDNLTSKGLIRVVPDHVLVWNDAQKAEAVQLHDVSADRVLVTGAHLFDHWFDRGPSRSRDEFCRLAGLDPQRPFVLYVGSSMFIAPDEVPFALRWISRLRASRHAALARAGVLIRPHPSNARQWRAFDPAAFENVALFPAIASDPNAAGFRRDYFDSLVHSAAVVGINTSAQIEAAIVGRRVFTIQAAEFAHSQAGTLHFQHLVNAETGAVEAAADFDAHLDQLAAALAGEVDTADANRRFVRAFIRPCGERAPAVPEFVGAIERLAALPQPAPAPDPWWLPAGRPPAFGMALTARLLAEDRPLWIYAVRPFLAAGVWAWAAVYRLRPVKRGLDRLRHETAQALVKRRRRAGKALTRAARHAGSAARRAGRGA